MPSVIWVSDTDYDAVSTVADSAYEGRRGFLKPERFEWAYQRAFSAETFFIQLMDEDRIVGHSAIISQQLGSDGAPRKVAQMADLFLMKPYQNFRNVHAMYTKMQSVLDEGVYDVVLTMPNARSIRLNQRFLGLSELRRLRFRGGFVRPKLRAGTGRSYPAEDLSLRQLADILEPFLRENPKDEIVWSPDVLAQRLQPPNHKPESSPITVHVGSNVALITSRNTYRGIVYTLVWGILSDQDEADPNEVQYLLRLAARYYLNTIFVYAGWNDRAALTTLGRPLPEKLRPSPLIVQGGAFDGLPAPDLKRYELIDFDFA